MTEKKSRKGIGGRPRKEVNWDSVNTMCNIQCTGEEIAAVLGMCYDTLDTRCKEEQGMSFSEYFRLNSAGGKVSLRRKQYQVAMDGNTRMLEHLGKHWLEQNDRAKLEVEVGASDSLIDAFNILDEMIRGKAE